jgi:hypothetical protein
MTQAFEEGWTLSSIKLGKHASRYWAIDLYSIGVNGCAEVRQSQMWRYFKALGTRISPVGAERSDVLDVVSDESRDMPRHSR